MAFHPSHIQNCTLKNALLWGMCKSHFHQVKTTSSLPFRIMHLVLGILESIPLLGQGIALIELAAVQIYKPSKLLPPPFFKMIQQTPSSTPIPKTIYPIIPIRPEPRSSIPSIETSIRTDHNIRRIWPVDLELLNLTPAQAEEVDHHIRDGISALKKGGELYSSKKKLQYTNGLDQVTAFLPITTNIFQANGELRIFLFPKTIFASGGERKIRWVYDLTKGIFLLKKKVVGIFEEKIIKYLAPFRTQRKIENSIIWRVSKDKQNRNKLQMIESIRNGTLSTLFGTAPLAHVSAKRDLVLDLLTDLEALHRGSISGVKIEPPQPRFSNPPPPAEFSYSLFHLDIKPLNILISEQNEKWRGELCDFGDAAANPNALVISLGFTPPEYIDFYKTKRPFGIDKPFFEHYLDVVYFNIQHGQGRDVWAMGLVILSLLAERQEIAVWENVLQKQIKTTSIPPLPCLKKILSGRIWNQYEEAAILDLKQETLDREIDSLEQEAASKHPKEETAELHNLFQMVKTMMLKINPRERKSIRECLASLTENQQQTA